VTYRVEPGTRFQVLTQHGSVAALGTVFQVAVAGGGEAEGETMKKQWAIAGASATLGALLFVSVEQGSVRLSKGEKDVVLGAGQSGSIGSDGIPRVESEAWIESSSPLRVGRNGMTRVTDVPGAMSGKRTVTGSSPARRVATREIPGNRFASAEQVTARNASPPANASDASRAFSVTFRSVPSDRMPDRRIRDRLRLKAR